MKTIISGLAIIFLLASCQKNNDAVDQQPLEGAYTGIFYRTGKDTSAVSISFAANTFSGSSDRINYPAICGGNFSLDNSTISFSDTCSWTANFDWTLILDGNYSYSKNGDKLEIHRSNGTVEDNYILQKVTR